MSLEYDVTVTTPCGDSVVCTKVARDSKVVYSLRYISENQTFSGGSQPGWAAKAILELYKDPSSPPTILAEDVMSLIVVCHKLETNSVCLTLMDDNYSLLFGRAIGDAGEQLSRLLPMASHPSGSRIYVRRHQWYWRTAPLADGCIVGGLLVVEECDWQDGPSEEQEELCFCYQVDLSEAAVETVADNHGVVFTAGRHKVLKHHHHQLSEPMTISSVFKGLFLKDPKLRLEWLELAKELPSCPIVSGRCNHCCETNRFAECVLITYPFKKLEDDMDADNRMFPAMMKLFNWARPIGTYEKTKPLVLDDFDYCDKNYFVLGWYNNKFWQDDGGFQGCDNWHVLWEMHFGIQTNLPRPRLLNFSEQL